METWLGNIGPSSGKFSLKIMIFISNSECSHIIDITGISEIMEKTLIA